MSKQFLLVGVIHLPPLYGFAGHPGFQQVLDKARRDIETLKKAGFHGALIENEGDRPHPLEVNEEYCDQFIDLMRKLRKETDLQLGLEILYDMVATVKVGCRALADFVRLDVYVDDTETRWGVVKASASPIASILATTSFPHPTMYADVHVKHGKSLTKRTLEESAHLSHEAGAGGLIVTGSLTGVAPTEEDCLTIKQAAPKLPLIIGSGFSTENAKKFVQLCDGAFVASSIKERDAVSLFKARALADHVKDLAV